MTRKKRMTKRVIRKGMMKRKGNEILVVRVWMMKKRMMLKGTGIQEVMKLGN